MRMKTYKLNYPYTSYKGFKIRDTKNKVMQLHEWPEAIVPPLLGELPPLISAAPPQICVDLLLPGATALLLTSVPPPAKQDKTG